GIDRGEFADAFRGIKYVYLIPAVVFTMLGHYSRAHRWGYMMRPIRRLTIGPLWSATAIAFMANNLLPARIGEFVRAYAIGKSEGISKSASFATIVYERVVDVFVLIVLLWFCLLRVSGPEWLPRSGIILIVFNALLLAMLYGMVRYQPRFRAILERITSPLPARFKERIHGWADAFIDGLGVVTSVRAALPIAVYSVAVWGFATLGVYFAVLAMGLDLPAIANVLLIVLISLGTMIPSGPAFLGTMQYACVVALGFYGVAQGEALAYSTVYHATQFFPITLTGLYYAWRAHLKFSEISRPDKESAPGTAG
ncbi:MAG: flippase-like domain-containing protein, partial [Candidatus Krumholzibacteriota bacterium]|nr:flippase-like domain-containing protein [Candidatus Krumholzibacteriota bacterium]